jgi:hypothetical protein
LKKKMDSKTTEFAATFNIDNCNGNKKKLKAWLKINLKGTFTRDIPWL